MSSDSEFEAVSSDQLMPEPQTFTHVPSNMNFKLKIGTNKKLGYTLKKDKELPYSTLIKGL